jgi:hypothetical protein
MVVEVSRAEVWSASVVLVFSGSSARLARPADDYGSVDARLSC